MFVIVNLLKIFDSRALAIYFYYTLDFGHNQLFVSEIQDNIFRSFEVFMSNLQKFVERLSELLIDHEMKAANLADALGVTRKTISRYRRGERLPDIDTALRMSAYFHCSLDFLLGRSDTGAEFDPLPRPLFKDRFAFLLDFFKTTKYRLIKDTQIDESVVYDWQKGTVSPRLESILILADYFGCSVEFVLGREN